MSKIDSMMKDPGKRDGWKVLNEQVNKLASAKRVLESLPNSITRMSKIDSMMKDPGKRDGWKVLNEQVNKTVLKHQVLLEWMADCQSGYRTIEHVYYMETPIPCLWIEGQRVCSYQMEWCQFEMGQRDEKCTREQFYTMLDQLRPLHLGIRKEPVPRFLDVFENLKRPSTVEHVSSRSDGAIIPKHCNNP